MNKCIKELIVSTLAGIMFLSGCALASEANSNQTSESTPVTGNNSEAPYADHATNEVILPTRPDLAAGGYATEEQILINSGSFEEAENALTAWTKYWADASNSPFQSQMAELHFEYVFDSSRKDSGVCMGSTTYPNTCFALPIVDGMVVEVPPTVNSVYAIPEEMLPVKVDIQMTADRVSSLGLDKSLIDSVLGWGNSGWVRIKNGETIATFNMETKQWEVLSGIMGIESLFMFSPEETVSFANMTTRIDKKVVDALGIKSVEAKDQVTENIYEVTMVYFAWELATQGESPDSKLEIFKNLSIDDLGSLEKVLAVYKQNEILGENGFDYTFDFGRNNIKTVDPALTDRPDKITGKVERIQSSLLYDYKEFEKLIDYLNKIKMDYATSSIPGLNTMIIFFSADGQLEIYSILPSYYSSMGVKLYKNEGLAGEVFSSSAANARRGGQYAIGEQFPKRGWTVEPLQMNLDLYTYNDDWSQSVYKFSY